MKISDLNKKQDISKNLTVAIENDTVQSSISWTLANSIKNLILIGTGVINGNGNSLNNTITGNSANNILNGGGGNDTLIGGGGNDTYVVDSTTDKIIETATGGEDTVLSSVSYSLAAIANVEHLTLTGTAAINSTGNSLNNKITGNSANNILNGGGGICLVSLLSARMV